MVSDITTTGLLQQAAQTQEQGATLAEDFTQFLTLLTTQLQNQDPLSPLDSKEFTDQLVQFTQVEQSISTNSKLDDLLALQIGSSSTSALGYVGLDITYVSAEVPHEEGENSTIRYSLDGTADVSRISIFDESGGLVFNGEAETSIGAHVFEWNGRDLVNNVVPTGTYTVRIDALDANENVIDTTTVVQSRVRGVEQQNGVAFALVGDRAVPVEQILSAVEPENEQVASSDEEDGGANGSAT